MDDVSSAQVGDATDVGDVTVVADAVEKLETTMATLEAVVQMKRQREDVDQHDRTLALIQRVEQLMPRADPVVDVETAIDESVDRLEEISDLMRSPSKPTSLVERLLGLVVRKRSKNDVFVSGTF